MLDLIWYFLPMIVFLGVITSYQDIKFGKIKNKWIVLALIYALVVNVILLLYINYTVGIRMHYVYELITNLLFSVLVGFFFWYFGIWSAADGKLFIAFSALVPLNVYQIGYYEWVPSFSLLVNVFLVGFFYFFVKLIVNVKFIQIIRILKMFLSELFQLNSFFNSIVYLFALYWPINYLTIYLNLEFNFFIGYFLTIFFLIFIRNIFGDSLIYFALFIGILRILFDSSLYSLSFLFNFIFLVFFWKVLNSIFKGAFSYLIFEIFSKEIPVNFLKPGMVLSEIIEKKDSITKRGLSKLKRTPYVSVNINSFGHFIKKPKGFLNFSNIIDEETEGLTIEQIKFIKQSGFKFIRISETTPFAFFIFLAVIFTILINGNILIFVI